MKDSMPDIEDVSRLADAVSESDSFLTQQDSIVWKPESWHGRLGNCEPASDALDAARDKSSVTRGTVRIDRDGVKRVAAKGDALKTFVTSQVWGHGTAGYGPYRVAVSLGLAESRVRKTTDFESSVNALEEAQALCQGKGGVAAYRYLVKEGKLPLLGPAFLTKFLFFIRDPSPESPRPIILDGLVRKPIEAHARSSLARRFGRTDYYESYLWLVDGVVEHLRDKKGIDCTNEDVEYALFRLGRAG